MQSLDIYMILEIPVAIMDVFHERLSWTLTCAISIGVSSKQTDSKNNSYILPNLNKIVSYFLMYL